MAARTVKSKSPAPDAAPPAARQRIISQARAHFLAHGFRTVTMDDLAAELGMSKKTLYAHFPAKTALIEAVLRDKLQAADADFQEIMSAKSSSFTEALHDLLACMKRHTDDIKPPFVRDLRRETPEMFAVVEAGRQDMIQRHFGKLFEAGRRAGTVRRDIPVNVLIEILLCALNGMVNPAKIETLKLTPHTAYNAVVTVILEGVLVSKGKANR